MTFLKERPILFNTEMVQAISKGRKSQTRRTRGLETFNKNPDNWIFNGFWYPAGSGCNSIGPQAFFKDKLSENDVCGAKCPYGQIGDILWVRESFCEFAFKGGNYVFKADLGDTYKWKPSIHMPKKAARTWLKIIDIEIQRLTAICAKDSIKEGIEDWGYCNKNYLSGQVEEIHPHESFKTLWQSINGLESWDLNPWVWVIKFEKLDNYSN